MNEINYKNVYPYSIDDNIKYLIKNSKIEYKKTKIIRVKENDNKEVVVETLNAFNEKQLFNCNSLFLGCGALSTYLVLKNSIKNFDENIKIKSTKQFVLPVKFNSLNNFKTRSFNKTPIFQLNLTNKSNFSLYSQIYNLNPNIVNFFLSNIKSFNKYNFFLKLFKNFGFSYFNMGSDYVDQFTIDNKSNVKIFENKFKASKILSSYNFIYYHQNLSRLLRACFPFLIHLPNNFYTEGSLCCLRISLFWLLTIFHPTKFP